MDTVSTVTINNETREIVDAAVRDRTWTLENLLKDVSNSEINDTEYTTVNKRFEDNETNINLLITNLNNEINTRELADNTLTSQLETAITAIEEGSESITTTGEIGSARTSSLTSTQYDTLGGRINADVNSLSSNIGNMSDLEVKVNGTISTNLVDSINLVYDELFLDAEYIEIYDEAIDAIGANYAVTSIEEIEDIEIDHAVYSVL